MNLSHVDEAQVVDVIGMRNLPWKGMSDNSLAPAVIDLNWLAAQPLLPFLVKTIPAPLLYRSLLAHGMEDATEIIEWIRGPQLIQILDYDLWSAASRMETLDVSVDKFLNWVRMWLDVDSEFAADRFFELDEETIVATLSKLLEIQPDEIAALSDLEKDEYYATPDGAFYIRLREDIPENFELFHQLLDAMYKKNLNLAQSCLAHASLLVRSESLEDELRWRAGRMSDAGFVSSDEAFELLKPRPIKVLLNELKSLKDGVKNRKLVATSTRFDTSYEHSDRYVEEMIQIIKAMPEEMAQEEIVRALSRDEIKLLTETDEAPETMQTSILLDDEEVLESTAKAIAASCTQLINRFEFSQSKKMTHRLAIEKALSKLADESEADAADLKARISRLSNIVASWNSPLQFPDDDLQLRAATLTRGFMNIGLELSLVAAETILSEEALKSELRDVATVQAVGCEMLFKLGYSAVCEAVTRGAELIELLASQRGQKLNFARAMAMGRFAEVRLWLHKNERTVEPALFLVLNSLLNKIPMFPVLLSATTATNHASTELKSFETTSEIEIVEGFFDALGRNASFQESL